MARHYGDWIKAYMEHTRHMEAPDRCHFWTAISTLGGVLQRCVWIDQKAYQWTPNFYIVLVAPAGIISKSTTANVGMKLLKQVKGVNMGPNSVTWQKLISCLGEAHKAVPISIDGKIQYFDMSALTIASSEMGNFLRPNDREMIDTLVNLWDGQIGEFEKKTKMSGDDNIVNPWVNIIACTTPEWIGDNFPEYVIGGGFFSRTIFVYGEKKRHLCPYLASAVPKDYDSTERKLIADLNHIAKTVRGPMVLTDEAEEYGAALYIDQHTNHPPHLASARIASYLARRQTHIHKLAMVLSAAQRDDRVIEKAHLEAAHMILEENETFLPKVFEKIGDGFVQKANSIVRIIQAHGSMSLDDAFGKLFYSMSYRDFKEGVDSAIQARLIRRVNKNGKVYLEAIQRDSVSSAAG